jgi:magnesium-transporting ATPase (P-type)
LVDTARNNGFVFYKRKSEEMVIRERGVDVTYSLLAVLEFSSVRRRMSVIVRTPQGQIKLYSKGADIVMFDRMADGDKGYIFLDISISNQLLIWIHFAE